MKKYLLDTMVLAGFLNGKQEAIAIMSPIIKTQEGATSILVYGEIIEGLKTLKLPQKELESKREQLKTLLQKVTPYTLTLRTLEEYADIRYSLGSGKHIGDVDTLIAAPAKERNLIVVTENYKHFSRVPGLSTKQVSLKKSKTML